VNQFAQPIGCFGSSAKEEIYLFCFESQLCGSVCSFFCFMYFCFIDGH
jgi:hypothetical protein